MLFVLIGLLLIALHFLGIGPPAAWNFQFWGDLWKFVLPFVLAVMWWAYADVAGLSRKREMRKLDERREARRQRSMSALGLGTRDKGSRKGSSR